MEQKISQLEKRISNLISWKNARVRERFTYPLDYLSTKILYRNQIRFTGKKITDVVGVTLTEAISVGFGLKINGKNKAVIALMPLKSFSASISDVISSGNHNLKESDRMYLTTTNTLPAPLSDSTLYYPVEITINTFKLSLTLGGSAINITNVGIGDHYYAKLQ